VVWAAELEYESTPTDESAAVARAEPTGRLKLAVRDEQGKPLPVRVCIEDAQGQFVLPPGEPSKRNTAHGGPFADEYFYIDGDRTIDLAPGPARIIAMRGVTYVPVCETVEVPAAGAIEKTITLKRLVDPAQRGWWSADEHFHRQTSPLMFQAEEINVGFTPICHTIFEEYRAGFPMQPYPDQQHLIGRCHAVEGNCFLWDLPQPIAITAGGKPWPEPLGGTQADWKKLPWVQPFIYRAAHQAGATIVPYMHDTKRRLPGGYYPLYVAHGWFDAYGIWENAMCRAVNVTKPLDQIDQYMALYFSFLNCGFRLPATAGSDLTAVGSSLWSGYNRFYTRLDGPFEFQKWKHAVKSGKTFVTNQPLLFVAVEGQDPGAEFRFSSSAKKPLAVEIEVFSPTPVQKIEIIANGKLLQEVPVQTPAEQIRARVLVDLPASAWFVVRCLGSSPDRNTGPKLTFAQTSPFYVVVDGQPLRSPEDAKFFRNVLTERLQADLQVIRNPAIAEDLKAMCDQAFAKYVLE